MEDRSEQGRELYELGLHLGSLGPVAIGAAGGTLAQALARSLGCGVVLAGNDARFHDGSCAACGVWLAEYYDLSAAVFIRQTGREIDLRVTSRDGHHKPRNAPASTGRWDWLTGSDGGWAARRAGGRCCGGSVAAEGPEALKLLLERLGCDVLRCGGPGVPVLRSDREGFRLTVEWNGMTFLPPGEDALAAAAVWLSEGRAIPAFKMELI